MRAMPAFQPYKRLLGWGVLLSSLWLAGCQNRVPETPDAGYTLPQQALLQIQPLSENARTTPLDGLDGQAVTDLLAAEIAGQRNQVDFALQLYLDQASRLRSSELARRAAYIGQYAGDNQATIDAAAIWSATDPQNSESRRLASTLLIQQGDYLEAFEYQKELLDLKQETHFSYLAAQSAQGDRYTRDELLLQLNQLRAEHPNNPDLLTATGQLLYFDQLFDEAMQAVDTSLGLEPTNVRTLLLKADILITRQGPAAGVRLLRQAVKAQPANLRLQLALARTLVKDGDIDQAQQVFARMAKSHPENGQLKLSLALILMENGLTDAARSELEKLVATEQEADEAHYYLGRLEEQAGNDDAAIDHYRRVKGGKEFLQAHSRASRLLIRQGAIQEARSHLALMRVTLPEYRIKLYLIETNLLQSLEQTDAAYQLLTEAIRSEGPDFELLYSRAMLSLEQGHIDAMETDLREILDADPNNAMVLNTLGYTLTEYSERYTEALLLIRKAAALKPGDPAITDSLGWVHFKLGQNNEAIHFLQQAYEQMQDPEVASHLVEVYWVAGHQEEAAALMAEALQLFPDSELLADLAQRFPPLMRQAQQQLQAAEPDTGEPSAPDTTAPAAPAAEQPG